MRGDVVGTPVTDQAPTGDLATHVRAWISDAFRDLADPPTVALIRGLAAAAADRDSDARLLYARLTEPARDALVARLQVAADSGQVASGTDLGIVADTLAGAVLYRVMARLPEPSTQDIDSLVTLVTSGIGARPPARGRRLIAIATTGTPVSPHLEDDTPRVQALGRRPEPERTALISDPGTAIDLLTTWR